MKGIPVLVPVKEPKEGMKVVIGKDLMIRAVYHNNSCECNESELQQIAIEYRYPPLAGRDSVKMHDNEEPIRVLLHPDDYEKVLPLIGQEVEFEIKEEVSARDTLGPYAWIDVARLITPAPVVYTEEEVDKIMDTISNFCPQVKTWWNTYKKK